MASGESASSNKYIIKDGIVFRPPHTFKTPPPTKIVRSYADMTGLEIAAYHGRRAHKAIPDYWPNVILLQGKEENERKT